MKKVLIAVVFLLLLGGGAGGYLYLNRAQEPEPEPPPPLPEFVKFERFVVPIVRQGFIDGFSRVEITLEVADIDIKREVERKTPRLRDAIQTDLHAYLPLRRGAGPGGNTDVAALKRRLRAVIDAQLGEGVVKDLLVEEFIDVPAKDKPRG